jgi:hypothetical protein
MQMIGDGLLIVRNSFVWRKLVWLDSPCSAAYFEPTTTPAFVLLAADVFELIALNADDLLAVWAPADNAHVSVAGNLLHIINIICHVASSG